MKCEYCGKEFQARHVKHKYCAECQEGVYSNPYVAKPKMIAHVPKPKPSKSLEQWAREANECNLDYGTYRALIASGKTFDTLKATADNRQLQTHSHIKMCSR